MAMTIEDLENAGFPPDSFPEDLPVPGEGNIFSKEFEGKKALYRYQVNVDGVTYGMEVLLDLSTSPDPAEGVGFMLNQFAFLWRQDRAQVSVQSNGACRRINF